MMSARDRADPQGIRAQVESLSPEGRGVARVDGKVVFIADALPGEEVSFCYTRRRGRFDEGRLLEVLRASPHRVQPRCAHFGMCGGCVLQHLDADEQVRLKQNTLLDNLQHIGGVTPDTVLDPLRGASWGYRRKARLGVRFVSKKQRVLVGFRERQSRYLADLMQCEVLHPSAGRRLEALAELIQDLSCFNRIAQVEVAVSDSETALVLRNLVPLSDSDLEKVRQFAAHQDVRILLQPGGPDSAIDLDGTQHLLSYALPEFDVELFFRPTDFTQVNSELNRQMVARAIELLQAGPEDDVLELFCGIGNFSLPIARRVASLTGVEGDAGLVQRASDNATRNGIDNAEFHVANLAGDAVERPWMRDRTFSRVLLDPPRSGAAEMIDALAAVAPQRIVYVSCNPATLARDAGQLVTRYGYRLEAAGVMDMFPHTAHVESIASFSAA